MSLAKINYCKQPFCIGVFPHCGEIETGIELCEDGIHQLIYECGHDCRVIELEPINGKLVIEASMLPINKEITFYVINPNGQRISVDLPVLVSDPCEEEIIETNCYSRFRIKTALYYRQRIVLDQETSLINCENLSFGDC